MPRQQDSKTSTGSTAASPTGATTAPNQATTGTASPGVLDQAKETVSNVASQAGDKVTSRLDAQKDRAAEGLSSIVQALRQTGQKMREQNQTAPAQEYLNAATDRVERVADYIRSTDVRQMVTQVEQYARRSPEIFIGGAFLLGLLGARFLKSSSQTNTGYAGPTPLNQSLTPTSNYPGVPPAPTGSGSRGTSAGGYQPGVSATGLPAERKEDFPRPGIAPPKPLSATTSPADRKGGV